MEVARRVDSAVTSVVARAEFATEWRNKRIAHRDLAHSLDRSAAPLPPASHGDVEVVLGSLAGILNDIESHYMRGSTLYLRAPITHGVMSLLYAAREGIRHEERRQKRLEAGEIRPEDGNDDAPALYSAMLTDGPSRRLRRPSAPPQILKRWAANVHRGSTATERTVATTSIYARRA